MAQQPEGWLSKLGSWLVPSGQQTDQDVRVTNSQILDELVASFDDSIRRESVGKSMLFNAHFLIILHPDTYEDRQNAFPVIVNEAVNAFKAIIESQRGHYERIAPVASSWFFKFGGGQEFAGEILTPSDVKVVGALTGILSDSNQGQTPDRVNVTRRVKQTNRYEKIDVDLNAFHHIDFREPGAFVVKFKIDSDARIAKASGSTLNVAELPQSLAAGLAQLDYYVAELNQENVYLMRDKEIVISRKEPDNRNFPNYLLIESAYVSNPHARIRYNDATESFQIASFSRNETRVNERLVPRSEPASPQWHALPDHSQILLNSIVTINFRRTNT